MDIESLSQPFAGELFNFRVTGGTRPTRIEVYIGRLKVIDKECDDPPCHEMVVIPANARGSEVRVIARDTMGNIEERKFQVGDSDTSAGGMPSVGG